MASDIEHQAAEAAGEFRRAHRLGIQPLGDLVALIEQTTELDVAVLDVGPDEHGLTMRDPARDRVFIGIARTRNPMRQRSTLAHELGHLTFQDWDVPPGGRPFEEKRADAFARHLLIPTEAIAEFLGDRKVTTEADLSDVVQRFLVSPAIAAIALRQAGYITAEMCEAWMNVYTPVLATRFGWGDYYASLQDDSDRVRAPQRLVARAINGYAEGVVTARQIAALRGLPVGSVVWELAEAGIAPVEHDPAGIASSDLPDVEVDLSGLDDADSV